MTEPSKTVAHTVASGDRLAALRATASKLANALDDDDRPAHTTAPIARELTRTLAAIAELEKDLPGLSIADALAEVKARRIADEAAGIERKVVRRGSRTT